ncbi:hypothetical protein ACFO3D_01785 [Virgibacillus kekensis]|uniref:Uncharacterized protein n=1 Tax=Virgibacillus kekensis TaxID=202261 RepID=A0ABV9DDQ5_9BACI
MYELKSYAKQCEVLRDTFEQLSHEEKRTVTRLVPPGQPLPPELNRLAFTWAEVMENESGVNDERSE